MTIPSEICFEDVDRSDAVEARILDEIAKLSHIYDHLMSARVVVARPQHRHHHGDVFQVRIYLTVPGAADIAVSREPAANSAHEDVYVAIRDAFAAAKRQTRELAQKRHRHVKTHEAPPHGWIARLSSEMDHGFINSSDGREIYFHKNAVSDIAFENLEIGQEVRFAEARGEKGPQATFVRPIGKHLSAEDGAFRQE